MQMNHTAFAGSRSLRQSLKRGLARAALATADASAPDLPALFRMAAGLRPNPKGLERLAGRLRVQPGVCRVALTREGTALSFVTRSLHEVSIRAGGVPIFREPGLIYLRAQVGRIGPGIGFRLSAVGFCGHALERLVERSDLALDRPLLPQVDDEALAIFRGLDRAARIVEQGDEFYPARQPGLWAGGHDELALAPEWGLVNGCGSVPIFSARTFLSASEMRPTLWLRWRDDPTCRMV